MRGDRPHIPAQPLEWLAFTPHARGSTALVPFHREVAVVYPACAGIDPARPRSRCCWRGLPRMRGDRPPPDAFPVVVSRFTPHARGSTPIQPHDPKSVDVYPACAGIDPRSGSAGGWPGSLPRMRGDRP